MSLVDSHLSPSGGPLFSCDMWTQCVRPNSLAAVWIGQYMGLSTWAGGLWPGCSLSILDHLG